MDQLETPSSRPWLAVGQEIAGLLERIDPQAFQRVVEAFEPKGRRWFFSGQGRSGLSAQMAAMRFMHIGHEVHFLGEVTAPSVRAGDGLLIISGSGQTPVSVSFAEIAKSQGAQVITLTRMPQSKLAGIADIVLPVPVQETAQFGGSLFEQSCLILLDAVILQLAAGIPDAHKLMWHRHTNMQ